MPGSTWPTTWRTPTRPTASVPASPPPPPRSPPPPTGPSTGWPRRAAADPICREVLFLPKAADQTTDNWTGDTLDRNRTDGRAEHDLLVRAELAKPFRGSYGGSLEALGLVEVVYPGSAERLAIPTEGGAARGGQPAAGRFVADLSAHAGFDGAAFTVAWPAMMAALLDTVRGAGCVTVGAAADTGDGADRRDAVDDRHLGQWLVRQPLGPGVAGRVVPFANDRTDARRPRFVQRVLQACGLAAVEAEPASVDLLGCVFDFLYDAAADLPWLQARDADGIKGLRVAAAALVARVPTDLWRSGTLGYVFARSVAGTGPELSAADLSPVTSAELDADGRLGRKRAQLRSPADGGADGAATDTAARGVWAEEHTAQLGPIENGRIQELFRRGMRNALSSSTTLELGIDIGGLNAVLMSNVPPGKANYLQRAGRAGRRADGSSVAVTFARSRPYDRGVFDDFGAYLRAPLRDPKVELTRERLVRRHAHAYLFNEFFRLIDIPRAGAMSAFLQVGVLLGLSRLPMWKGKGGRPAVLPPEAAPGPRGGVPAWWPPGRPLADAALAFFGWAADHGWGTELSDELATILSGTTLAVADAAEWRGLVGEAGRRLRRVVESIRRDYARLTADWEAGHANAAVAKRVCNGIAAQAEVVRHNEVIRQLGDDGFLPRYGFPINVQRLFVMERDGDGRPTEDKRLQLERPGLMALREYAPGSTLIAGGRRVTSHGVRKHWAGSELATADVGFRRRLFQCGQGHHYTTPFQDAPECPYCGDARTPYRAKLFIPKYGYSTAAWDPPNWTDAPEQVGTVHKHTISFGRSSAAAGPDGDGADAPVRLERADFAGIAGADGQLRGGDRAAGLQRRRRPAGVRRVPAVRVRRERGGPDRRPAARGVGRPLGRVPEPPPAVRGGRRGQVPGRADARRGRAPPGGAGVAGDDRRGPAGVRVGVELPRRRSQGAGQHAGRGAGAGRGRRAGAGRAGAVEHGRPVRCRRRDGGRGRVREPPGRGGPRPRAAGAGAGVVRAGLVAVPAGERGAPADVRPRVRPVPADVRVADDGRGGQAPPTGDGRLARPTDGGGGGSRPRRRTSPGRRRRRRGWSRCWTRSATASTMPCWPRRTPGASSGPGRPSRRCCWATRWSTGTRWSRWRRCTWDDAAGRRTAVAGPAHAAAARAAADRVLVLRADASNVDEVVAALGSGADA